MRAAWLVTTFWLMGWAGDCSAQIAPSAEPGDLSQSASVEISRWHQTGISEAQAHLQAGEIDQAMESLQNLLEAEPAFVPADQGNESSHAVAQRLLATLPPAWLARYEERYGGIARARLDSARRENNWAAVVRISEQYPLTQAGHEALRLSAVWHFDHGEFLPAAAGFQAISEHPFTRQTNVENMRPADVRRWKFARSQLGHPTSLATSALPASNVVWEQHASLPEAPDKLVHAMHEELLHRGFLPLASFTPIVVGDLVISRRLAEVAAYDRSTGAVRWRTSTDPQTLQLAGQGLMANPRFREMLSWQLAAQAFADKNAGTLTSDGSRVFAVLTDHAHDGFANLSPFGLGKNFMEDWNSRRLSCCQLLALDAATGKELWRRPEVLPHRDPALQKFSGLIRDPQPDVFFFGPPLPLGGSLYLVGQKDREIRLYVLSALTGEIDWSLPLAMTELPLMKDPLRRRQACPVVPAGGLLLCPTGAGALAAVDPRTRTCRWIFRYHRDDLPKLIPGAFPAGHPNMLAGLDRWWTSWRDVRVVAGQETVLLATPESHRLHAVALRTGKPLWNLPKGDGLFLTDVLKDSVLLIGSSSVRAVNLDNGKIDWTHPIPTPGGRGVISITQAGPKYLLPLQAGGVLQIDPARKTAERTFPINSEPTGNLVVNGETILSQTHDRLLRLAPLSIETMRPSDSGAQFLWAKSQREAGRFREAVKVLLDLAKNEATADQRDELRETLLTELSAHPERAEAVFKDLEPLMDSPGHRIRGYRALAEAEGRADRSVAALEFWLKLLEENPTGHVTNPDDPALEIAYSRYIQGAILDLLDSAEPGIRLQLEARLNTHRKEALSGRDPFAVSRFARRFDQLQSGRELMVAKDQRSLIGQSPLAQQLGLWAIAEAAGDRAIQAMAFRRLADDSLLELRFREAAFFLRQLRDVFQDVNFPDGQSVSAYLETLPKDSPVRKLLNTAERPPAARLQISEQPRQGRLPNLFQVPVSAQPGSLSADLDVWLDPIKRRLRFAGAGRAGFWELALPGEEPLEQLGDSFFRAWGVGPIFVFGCGTELYGIAPLDDHGEPRPRVLWRIEMAGAKDDDEAFENSLDYRAWKQPPGFGGRRVMLVDPFEQSVAQVGPVTAGYLVYHSRGRLIAIEPATGKKLWSRSRLPTQAITTGDAGSVLISSPNDPEVTVLRALDGRVVVQRQRPASGRLLDWWGTRGLFQEDSSEQIAFSLWDAVAGRRRWSVKTPPKTMGIRLDDRLWGYLTAEGQISVLDVETGQRVASAQLSEVQSASDVHVTMDSHQFYLAVEHAGNLMKQANPLPEIVDDLPIRHPIFEGTLLALDRRSGKLAWQSPWGKWAFPLEQPASGPVLVLFHREKSQPDRNRSIVRCLDKRTGREVYRAESPAFREIPHWSGGAESPGFELHTPNVTVRFQ